MDSLRTWQMEHVRRIAVAHHLDGERLLPILTANKGASSRLELLINLVTRLEIRLRHDAQLVRARLTGPQPSLAARVPIELVGEVDAPQLTRGIVNSLVVERPRTWRVALKSALETLERVPSRD